MLIPIGADRPGDGRFPWMVTALVVANVVCFAGQVILGLEFTCGYALVPREITEMRDITGTQSVVVKVGRKEYRTISVPHYPGPTPILLTLITSLFLHGGLLHLLGNLCPLIVFGRSIETALGPWRFLVFYLLCGVAAGLAHIATDQSSLLHCLGASGAIAGLMGAYLAIYPFNTIRILVGPFGVVKAPALVVCVLWFAWEYLFAILATEYGSTGVGHVAHIGGFLAGVIGIWGLILYLRLQKAQDEAESPKAAPEEQTTRPRVQLSTERFLNRRRDEPDESTGKW